jgi:Tol biopolymer transport system component
MAMASGLSGQIGAEETTAEQTESTDSTTESCAADPAAAWIGRDLAHYHIVEKLGAGGMGVVYRAVDSRLGRSVALKLLQADKGLSPLHQRRFLQEARSASSLNHPNIVTIYDTGGSGDVVFIAMELVPGVTLRETIAAGPIALPQAIRFGSQIADALAAAHAAGIVHRDLKPANIMITEKGLVKVLDFGIAKFMPLSPSPENTETMGPETIHGTILGTPGYMSPEQAEGKAADQRSDIFSFGAILYELATGRRAFHGGSKMATLAAGLNGEPTPVRQIAPGVPEALDRVIVRCLSKNPVLRVQNMEEAKAVLDDLDARFAARALPPRRSWLFVLALAAMLLLALAAVWYGFRGSAAPAAQPVLSRLTSWPGLTAYPAVSPDGKLIAYASDRESEGSLHIWVRLVGADTAGRRLTEGPDDDYDPAFSPDGTRLAYRSERNGGGIYVISALGGEPRLVVREGFRPRFSPDGSLIAYWSWQGALGASATYVVRANGGPSRQLAPSLVATRFPIWLPDGRILVLGQQGKKGEIRDWWIVSPNGGPPVPTHAFARFAAAGLRVAPVGLDLGLDLTDRNLHAIAPEMFVSEPDRVLFSAARGDTTNIWQIPLDLRTGAATGSPRQVTFGTALEVQPSGASSVRGGPPIVFSALALNVNVWSLPISPEAGSPEKAAPPGELQRITNALSFDAWPSASRDGRHIVFASYESGRGSVLVRDLSSGREVALVEGMTGELQPTITAAGDMVSYTDEKSHTSYMVSAEGGAPAKLCDHCLLVDDWMHDGSHVLAESDTSSESLLLIDAHSRRRIPLIRSSNPKYLGFYSGRFSPDDRWISFHAHTGPLKRQIFIAPLRGETPPPEQDWIPITDGQNLDRNAAWSVDGNVLYFLSERDRFRCIWGQRLDPVSRRPVGPPFAVRHFHETRRSLLAVGDNVGAIGLVATRDKLFFALGEVTGNIWRREAGER